MTRTFPLAPMNGVIFVLTAICLPIPVIILIPALLVPGPQRPILFGTFVFVFLIYASVWIWWRPSTFSVDATGVTIAFPGRAMRVDASEISSARIVDAKELKPRYGAAARVGAGGLWGGFGWLWTSKRGMVDMYISRTDRFVLVERVNGRDLLITPDRAEEFVSAVAGRA